MENSHLYTSSYRDTTYRDHFYVKGKIHFDPINRTKKHELQGSWKTTALLLFDCDLDAYYRWFLKRRYNLTLNPPLRGAHVTFINDRLVDNIQYEAAKAIFEGKEVEVKVELQTKSNGKHWWLRVVCDELKNIRELAGFTYQPHWGLHMTIGLVKDLEHEYEFSEYILRQAQRFENAI